MAITDSEAAFKARAAALGLQEPVLQLLVDGGLNTMSRFAFSSAYVPGHPDETAFVAALKTIMSRDPEVAELAILRRLLRESYALSASALKQIAEQTEDGPARKLSQPERAERLQKQQSRITGLQIQGVYEPSDRMIDKLVQMYENDRLQYVELKTCASKEFEVRHASAKEDKSLAVDSSGMVKMKIKEPHLEPDTSTDFSCSTSFH